MLARWSSPARSRSATRSSCLAQLSRDPDRVFAAGVRSPVEPAIAADHLEARALEQPAPLVVGEPREHEASSRPSPPGPTASGFAPASPSRRARRSPAPARASGRSCRRCPPRSGAKTSNTSRPPGTSSSRAAPQRAQARILVGEGAGRTEGQVTSPTRSSTGGASSSPSRKSSSSLTPARSPAPAADLEHPGRGVDADHAHRRPPRSAPHSPRAHCELDHRGSRPAGPPGRRSRRPR